MIRTQIAQLRLAMSAIAIFVLLAAQSRASVTTIDFESDPLGDYGPAFVSVDSPLVTFRDSAGGAIIVRTFFDEAIGQGIEAYPINGGMIMDFAVPVTSVSVLFGNDDPSAGSPIFPEDRALLRVFSGALQVGQSIVPFNFNDLADQTISVSGVGNFNRAVLTYVDSTLNIRSNLGEVFEEIHFTTVPEPTASAMCVIGTVLFSCMRWSKHENSRSVAGDVRSSCSNSTWIRPGQRWHRDKCEG